MSPSKDTAKGVDSSSAWGPRSDGFKSGSCARETSVKHAYNATEQPTCQQQPSNWSPTSSTVGCAHYVDWIRVFLMILASFNHTMWLAGLGTSNSPAYGGVPTPQTGPITYIVARYLASACLSYSMALFFLRTGYADSAVIRKVGSWQFLVGKTRVLLGTIIVWELFLYPMVLCIGSGMSVHSIYQSYFSNYAGTGQLQMWAIVMLQLFSWSLVAIYSLSIATTSMCRCVANCGQRALLPTLQRNSSTAAFLEGGSAHSFLVCVPGSFVDLAVVVDKDASNMLPIAFDKLGDIPNADPTIHMWHNPPYDCTSLALPSTAPFRTRFMFAAVASLIITQTGVMFGFTVTKGFTWNLHGIIVQYCFMVQYIISYFLGAYMERYKALERLPARFGYWCLCLSIVVYTSAYVGSVFRPVAGHGSALVHVVDDWGLYMQQSVSPWSERLPSVSVQLSPHAPNTGLLLSTASAPWLLFDCFITQTWAVMFTVGLLVFSRLHINKKPGKLGQMMIDASYAFYFLFPLVLVSLARALAHVQLHPFAFVAVVWPLCFSVTYALAITIRSLPGASLFL